MQATDADGMDDSLDLSSLGTLSTAVVALFKYVAQVLQRATLLATQSRLL